MLMQFLITQGNTQKIDALNYKMAVMNNERMANQETITEETQIYQAQEDDVDYHYETLKTEENNRHQMELDELANATTASKNAVTYAESNVTAAKQEQTTAAGKLTEAETNKNTATEAFDKAGKNKEAAETAFSEKTTAKENADKAVSDLESKLNDSSLSSEEKTRLEGELKTAKQTQKKADEELKEAKSKKAEAESEYNKAEELKTKAENAYKTAQTNKTAADGKVLIAEQAKNVASTNYDNAVAQANADKKAENNLSQNNLKAIVSEEKAVKENLTNRKNARLKQLNEIDTRYELSLQEIEIQLKLLDAEKENAKSSAEDHASKFAPKYQ